MNTGVDITGAQAPTGTALTVVTMGDKQAMLESGQYEVYAIKYAERINRTRAETFIFEDDHISPHPMDYFIWVVRNEHRTILIDTGYDGGEASSRERPILIEPREALSRIGIKPDSIEQIVITHLHYDHAGGLAQFPGARLHMQEAEMAYATGPCMCYQALQAPFTAGHVCEAVKRVYSGLVKFHDGDGEIAPGLTVHLIGGHSSGLQCVRVMTANGPLVLASDAAHYYENYEEYKPFRIVADVPACCVGLTGCGNWPAPMAALCRAMIRWCGKDFRWYLKALAPTSGAWTELPGFFGGMTINTGVSALRRPAVFGVFHRLDLAEACSDKR